jgi:Putative Actinobacterial Holin-X, holin superfamily III
MEETQALNGERETFPDWSILVGRAVEDVSNILHAETHLLQINVGAALKAQIDYAFTTFAMLAALICAGICFVTALILLLHQSFPWQLGLPWWEAFAIGGLLLLVVALAIRAIAGRRATLPADAADHSASPFALDRPSGSSPAPARNPVS